MVRSNLVSISVSPQTVFQINITNTQNTATPVPFQQMIQLPISQLGLINPYIRNIGPLRFSYNGSYIPAWLESISNGVATIWVKLPVSIPANSSITIDMEVDPSLNFDGVYWGEAPQLSPTYAEYDNGVRVFNFYDNFAGTSLNTSKWTAYYNGYITVNNGITFGSGGLCFIETNTKYSISNILEMYVNSGVGSDSGIMYAVDVNGNQYTNANYGEWIAEGSSAGQAYNAVEADMRSNYAISQVYLGSGSNIGYPYPNAPLIAGVTVPNSANGILYVNDVPVTTNTQLVPPQGNYYITLGGYQSNLNVYYVRTRAYPPNGVMPSIEVIA